MDSGAKSRSDEREADSFMRKLKKMVENEDSPCVHKSRGKAEQIVVTGQKTEK